MIIAPNYFHDPMRVVHESFESAKIAGHSILLVNCNVDDNSFMQEIQNNIPKNEDINEIYTLGFDFDIMASKLTYSLYQLFGDKPIRCVARLEDPDFVQYIYKQSLYPDLSYLYNAEPFITLSKKTAKLYYYSVCNPADFNRADELIEEFGDFWNVSHSEYEQKRMRNIRDIVVGKIKKIFDVGSYLGQLDDLLEMNGIDVIRSDISPAVIKRDKRILDLRIISASDIREQIKTTDAIMFASVLFAYSGTKDSTIIEKILAAIKAETPKYIVYEDSIQNLYHPNIVSNEWLELFGRLGYNLITEKFLERSVEPFYENKNILRAGSFVALMEHFKEKS